MEIESTGLAGSCVLIPRLIEDSRGFFSRSYCDQEFFDMNGINNKWVQINNSMSINKGTLRGLHYQCDPFQEDKLVRCIRGELWDVIVDVRPTSLTFLQWFGCVLSADNRKMMYVPRGFAHGFITLSDNVEIIYNVTAPYSRSHERTIKWNSNSINIKWPIDPTIISEKDSNGLEFPY